MANANGGSMSSAADGAPSSFSDRLLRFLERVEHRIARTDGEREAAFQLRHDAYVRNDLMGPQADRRLFDKGYDTGPRRLDYFDLCRWRIGRHNKAQSWDRRKFASSQHGCLSRRDC